MIVLIGLREIFTAMVCYSLPWMMYRWVIHPDWSWKQEKSAVRRDARNFALVVGLILFTAAVMVQFDVVKLIW